MARLRWLAIAVLLFLVIAIDFTSRMMSVVADGAIIFVVISLLWPLVKANK